MNHRKCRIAALLLLAFAGNAQAVDSYRYLHVTIDTVWHIFLFLLPLVLAPLVLVAWLYWRYAKRGKGPNQDVKDSEP
ncbi:MAG: hypothetical protein Q7U07_04955 [Gammaproteobacteria bacterium]|nr:hypothetical protein [Gammaproteobacteria bacterium]